MTLRLGLVFFVYTFLLHINLYANVSACKSAVQINSEVVYFYDVKAQIPSPESLPQVKRAIKKIKALIDQANTSNGIKARIYTASLASLTETLNLGEKIIQEKANSQDDIFDFFYQFTKLIDLPKDYADQIGRYADGFDYIDSFTDKKFEERLAAFSERYKDPSSLLDFLNKALLDKKNRAFHLTKSFKYISVAAGDKLPDNLNFSFQYQYIFKKALLGFTDLFKERESGKFFMGVSFKDFSPYDGQHGDSNSFLRHDYLHSYIQKYYDQKLFDEFGANNLESQVRLKKLTHHSLKKRVAEFSKLSDPNFKEALEIVLFALLHDVGLSYPIGTHHYLSNKDSRKLFTDTLLTSLKSNFYGKQKSKLEESVITQALDWVLQKSTEDSSFVRENY